MFTQGRVSHAIAFAGPEGSSSLALAIAFARFICCKNRAADSCGKCPSCLKFEKNIHPDVHFYFPTVISEAVPKKPLSSKYYSQWRKYLETNMFPSLNSWLRHIGAQTKEAIIPADESLQIVKDLSLMNYESESRFAILWLPERMNASSANKLLKILEEPQPGIYFFLVTENPQAVLPTLISRCQLLLTSRLAKEEITEWLGTFAGDKDPETINAAAEAADGLPGLALSYLESDVTGMENGELFLKWARLCYKAYDSMPELMDCAENLAALSREEQKIFLDHGISFFRKGILIKSGAAELITAEKDDPVANFSSLLNAGNCRHMVTEFGNSIRNIERNANQRILFLDLSLEFARSINPKNVNL